MAGKRATISEVNEVFVLPSTLSRVKDFKKVNLLTLGLQGFSNNGGITEVYWLNLFKEICCRSYEGFVLVKVLHVLH